MSSSWIGERTPSELLNVYVHLESTVRTSGRWLKVYGRVLLRETYFRAHPEQKS